MAIDGIDDIRKYIEQRKSVLQSAILENNYDDLQCIYSENNVILFRVREPPRLSSQASYRRGLPITFILILALAKIGINCRFRRHGVPDYK